MPRPTRTLQLHHNDDFRGSLTYALVPLAIVAIYFVSRGERVELATLLAVLCGLTVVTSLIYIVWTHLLFTRTPHARMSEIAAIQHASSSRTTGRAAGRTAGRILGFTQQGAGSTSLWSAALTITVAVASILVGGTTGGVWLPMLVLATAATSWATMVYSFALQYYRLHFGGERITFDIDEEPEFSDFVSMSVMVSSVGALSAGTPRTRKSLRAVRTHTYIAFIFNALVVAITVSILSNLISSLS